MRKALIAALLFTTSAALAQQPPRPIFPDDYTPSPCAPDKPCQSYDKSELRDAAFTMLALKLDSHWIEDHYEQMLQLYAPVCRKHATCFGTAGTNFLFCDDIMINEYRAVCDKAFPKATSPVDFDQCNAFTEIWALGVDMKAKWASEAALQCVKEKGLDTQHTKPPEVWMVPSVIPRGYTGYITIYAIDPDTHVPIKADFAIEKTILYTATNPAGNLSTGYPFKWPVKYLRVKNAAGHEDVVSPMVTVKPAYYPPVSFPMPTQPGKMIVSMTPAKLRPGKNTITVTAKDALTGEPVEARVMANEEAIGDTNQIIEVVVPKGKSPEIWVTSLFDTYSDVVVAK